MALFAETPWFLFYAEEVGLQTTLERFECLLRPIDGTVVPDDKRRIGECFRLIDDLWTTWG